MNSIDRIKEMVTIILLLCGAQDYNQVISHVILSQIFATARNTYCILSDQCTDNSSCFLLW